MSETDTVFIGRKPAMNYVLACITCFHGGSEEVKVKARGRAISRAIDVVEITRRRFMPDLEVKNIDISTEKVPSYEEGGMPVNISSIEIKLTNKP
jgi:DNA-binding protein